MSPRLLSRKSRIKPGDRFGRLTVSGHVFVIRDPRLQNPINYCVCACACGSVNVHNTMNLRSGKAKSCGCLGKENQLISVTTRNGVTKSHRILYRTWYNMKMRCYATSNHAFNMYGGRGITICDEWRNDPEAFVAWALQAGWEIGLHIDRIDNDAGYSPSNCRCVTRIVNANNTRRNIQISAFGETKTLAQWSRDKRCSVTSSALAWRLKHGETPEHAITAAQYNLRRRDVIKKDAT